VTIIRAFDHVHKEYVVIKKVTIDQDMEKIGSLSNLPQNKELSTESGLLYNEGTAVDILVSNLKEMNIPRILKCLQLIKTKRSLYLVYENYPELNLLKYLKENESNPVISTIYLTQKSISPKSYVKFCKKFIEKDMCMST